MDRIFHRIGCSEFTLRVTIADHTSLVECLPTLKNYIFYIRLNASFMNYIETVNPGRSVIYYVKC